jgi:protein involved in polysaccharide export with SLBB domain
MHLPSISRWSSVATLLLSLLGPVDSKAQEDHKITTGDSISVNVYNEVDLDVKAVVNASGKVPLNLIGEVRVVGLSCEAAARVIEAAYKEGYLVNPKVTVRMEGYARKKFTITGEVTKPSAYTFGASDKVSLLQAIGTAGGFTKGANPSKVIVRRTVNGKVEVLKVNAKELQADPNAKPFEIMDGDEIKVEESAF